MHVFFLILRFHDTARPYSYLTSLRTPENDGMNRTAHARGITKLLCIPSRILLH
jgi:hypothetical protein